MEKVIVVTGGNDGIGLSMVTALLEKKYFVAVLDIFGNNLNSLCKKYPDQFIYFRCDVTDMENVREAISTIIDKWKHIDLLINNACIAIFKTFEERTILETRKEFEVNYFGYLNTITAVLPYMKLNGGGMIHNMSSGVGITGFPGIYGYASTKGAIEAMTRTLALEFKKYNITVNIMHPPLTNTKSASPLGIPAQAMDDPIRVGRNLAKKILSTNPVIASDLRTSVYLFFAYRYPTVLGYLFAKLAEGAKK
jgi:NAD(P)-dependent dehydrogenase (short-subunit alcohol dehydrogenase family)